MNPWIAKSVILAASVVMVAVRAPHGQRSRGVKVVKNRKGKQEVILLTLAWLGFFVPLIWVVSPAFVGPVPASRWSAHRRSRVPRGGPLAVPPISRRPRDQLVGHASSPRTASTHHARYLSTHPPSDVSGTIPLLPWAVACSSELDCRSVVLDHIWDPFRVSCA